MAKTEHEKMMAGELYHSFGPDFVSRKARSRSLMRKLNCTHGEPEGASNAREILKQILGKFSDREPPFVETPFYFDYVRNNRVIFAPPSTLPRTHLQNFVRDIK